MRCGFACAAALGMEVAANAPNASAAMPPATKSRRLTVEAACVAAGVQHVQARKNLRRAEWVITSSLKTTWWPAVLVDVAAKSNGKPPSSNRAASPCRAELLHLTCLRRLTSKRGVDRMGCRKLHLPLKRGGRRAVARRVGIASRALRLIPTRLARPRPGS